MCATFLESGQIITAKYVVHRNVLVANFQKCSCRQAEKLLMYFLYHVDAPAHTTEENQWLCCALKHRRNSSSSIILWSSNVWYFFISKIKKNWQKASLVLIRGYKCNRSRNLKPSKRRIHGIFWIRFKKSIEIRGN